MNPVFTNLSKFCLATIRRCFRGSTVKQPPHTSPFAENCNVGSFDSNQVPDSQVSSSGDRAGLSWLKVSKRDMWFKPFSLLRKSLPFPKPTLPKWFGVSLNGTGWFGKRKTVVGPSVFKTVSIEQRRAIQANALLNSVKVKRNDLTDEGTEVLTLRKPSRNSASSPFIDHRMIDGAEGKKSLISAEHTPLK